MENVLSFLSKVILTIVAILSPIHTVMIAAGVLIVADLITGIIAAKKRGEPISSAGFRRTVSKMLVFQSAVICGFITEQYLLKGTVPVTNIVASVIGLTELTSILENLNSISGTNLLQDIIKRIGSDNDKKN